MPTIVFANPKGGAGKSTAAVILATQLGRRGAKVTILDVSSSGFRLGVSESPRVGELVTLRDERGDEFFGQIRWVLGDEAGGVFQAAPDAGRTAAAAATRHAGS